MKTRWLAAAVFLFIWSLTTHGKYSASGDEPHYLMITHSLDEAILPPIRASGITMQTLWVIAGLAAATGGLVMIARAGDATRRATQAATSS